MIHFIVVYIGVIDLLYTSIHRVKQWAEYENDEVKLQCQIRSYNPDRRAGNWRSR